MLVIAPFIVYYVIIVIWLMNDEYRFKSDFHVDLIPFRAWIIAIYKSYKRLDKR
jgi:hypothetical protein